VLANRSDEINAYNFLHSEGIRHRGSIATGHILRRGNCVNNAILPLANRNVQQLGDIGCRRLDLHFDNSKFHTARHVQGQMASRRCVRVPYPPHSPDLAIAGFYLFGRLKRQLSGRTLDSEDNVLETITETLSELPKDEIKVRSGIEKKMPVNRRP
jgi:hypothetical protein